MASMVILRFEMANSENQVLKSGIKALSDIPSVSMSFSC